MKRILFIVPPHITFESFVKPSYNERSVIKNSTNLGSVITDMPLGVFSLSAYLKKHFLVQTMLIDFNIVLNKLNNFNFNSFKDFFCNYLSNPLYISYAPDLICISALFTPSYQSVLDIADCSRVLFPNPFIVAGGGVPTNMFKEIFRDSTSFDALCYGEGEKPLLGLVSALDKTRYLEETPSWITNQKIKNNILLFKHDFIKNLDDIPFYDYDLCEINEYGLNPSITAYATIDEKKQNFHVMTSRGCPHNCCFCASHTVHGKKMRYHSIKRIRDDFTRIVEHYGAKTLVFQDDHLMANRKRVFQIIEIIKELKVTAVFQNALAMYALDRKMLEALKSAGVKQLSLSIESGSNRVLKEIIHKPLDLSIVKRVSDDCRDLGIYTNVAILIGLPGETKQDIEDARSFLKTIYSNWFLIFCASPLIGSEMYEICKKKNYLKNDCIGIDYKKAVIETEDFTAEYVQDTAYLLNLELNFVENSDYRLGNYDKALKGFEHVVNIKNDHAIAYYYAAKCCKKLSMDKKYEKYIKKYKEIIEESIFWKRMSDIFNLDLSP